MTFSNKTGRRVTTEPPGILAHHFLPGTTHLGKDSRPHSSGPEALPILEVTPKTCPQAGPGASGSKDVGLHPQAMMAPVRPPVTAAKGNGEL